MRKLLFPLLLAAALPALAQTGPLPKLEPLPAPPPMAPGLSDDDTGPRLVATQVLPEIAAGTRLDGIQFDLRPADVGCCGWLVRVDEESALYECDETNNEDRWSDTTCP